jgi:hypothetical protein
VTGVTRSGVRFRRESSTDSEHQEESSDTRGVLVDEATELLSHLSLQEPVPASSYNWDMDHGDGSGRMRRYSGTVGTIDLPDF